jgi:MFS family permease
MIISISPFIRNALKLFALATSTMHYFAVIILLPLYTQAHYGSVTSFEIAVIIAGHTAGFIFGYSQIEFLVRRFGIKTILNLGFLLLTVSSFALWHSTKDFSRASDFAAANFLSRLFGGIGCGLLNTACLISRGARSEETDAETVQKYFRQHMAGEALGYMLGPITVLCVYENRQTEGVFLHLAMICSFVWMLSVFIMTLDYCFTTQEPEQNSN